MQRNKYLTFFFSSSFLTSRSHSSSSKSAPKLPFPFLVFVDFLTFEDLEGADCAAEFDFEEEEESCKCSERIVSC